MGFDFDFEFYGLWVASGSWGGGVGYKVVVVGRGIQIGCGEVLEVVVWCDGGLKATMVVA